ncbi:IS66 family transposase [Pseudomonas sp. H3_H05]
MQRHAVFKVVVYDFSPTRAGEHARNFLGQWNGKLVCDDFAGYKAGFEKGITEIGCMVHARRKFFDLHVANKNQQAEQALYSIGGLYEIERQARDMNDEDRCEYAGKRRHRSSKRCMTGMLAQRDLMPNGSATAKALDYSLKRWVALTRYLEDGLCPSTIIRWRPDSAMGSWAIERVVLKGRFAAANAWRRS